MVGSSRDLMSFVEEARVSYARILQSMDDSLTTIQKQASRDRLIRELKDEGISFDYFADYESCIVSFNWSSADIRGAGVITDVKTVGDRPIVLSSGDDVTVIFEPRDLKRLPRDRLAAAVAQLNRDKISNVEFAPLKKGSAYEFQGRIRFCRFYPRDKPNGHFIFEVERAGQANQRNSTLVTFFSNLFTARSLGDLFKWQANQSEWQAVATG
jgi:hypothetical protein